MCRLRGFDTVSSCRIESCLKVQHVRKEEEMREMERPRIEIDVEMLEMAFHFHGT